MVNHDPLRVAREIRDQLASDKRRLAFFFGAGTSMAVGIPGIDELTQQVSAYLKSDLRIQYDNIRKDVGSNANVENVLDRIRTYRELIGDSEEKEFSGLKGATAARNLDSQVCKAICKIVRVDPPRGLKPHLIFSHWLKSLHSHRERPIEIFTTNYDLLIEQALEKCSVPFFDGFVGSFAPFFVAESVEAEYTQMDLLVYPPPSWIRLSKLHGSINWFLQEEGNRRRITRLTGSEIRNGDDLMIFPSREKYTQSRKTPFLTFQDRFRKFLSQGECLVVVIGYKFSDEHLNEVMFQALRSNSRLAVTVFAHSNLPDIFIEYGKEHRNLTLLGPDKACIGGVTMAWGEPSKSRREETRAFWDEGSKTFTLGDFNSFTSFLEAFIGFRSTLDNDQKGTSSPTGRELLDEGISK